MARILLIANAESIHTQRWLDGLRNLGHELHLLSHSYANCPDDVVLHVLPITLRALPRTLPQVRTLVRKLKPQIVHGHQVISEGLYAALSGHPRVIVSALGSDVLLIPKRSVLLRLMVKSVLWRAQVLTADSQDLVRTITDLVPSAAAKVHCFPMGIERQYADAARSLPQKKPIILSTRSLKSLYNVDLIIRAFALVNSTYSYRLVIAADGQMRGKLEELAVRLNVHDRVDFVGLLPRETLARYYAQAEVFVSIPSSDATSVSLLEAMNWGCLPIVSDLPANREWIEHGRNGLIVTPNEEELARALQRALEDADLRLKACRLNQALIRERAIWEDNLAQMEAIYTQLLAGGRGSR
ncbi:MAG: glycosyltransferase family 4 protein [Betaproteobacteria bacterium]